jgi:23S rRNA (uracil-5-)-methyltransferase RumA
VVQSDRTDVLYGQDYFYEELLGLKFRISPFSFFQTNTYSAEVLYETAREYVGEMRKEQIVYDLYSGTGTIAQLMAPVAKKVIGVEIVEEAVRAAVKNAAENGLDNCEFIAGDVLKVLDGIGEKPDLIILDPPRDGIHPKALPKIIGYGVERIVYISCKPTSLVRDLEVFLERGYRVRKADTRNRKGMLCCSVFTRTMKSTVHMIWTMRDCTGKGTGESFLTLTTRWCLTAHRRTSGRWSCFKGSMPSALAPCFSLTTRSPG